MNVEYINPFIEASMGVINQMTGLQTSIGKVNIKHNPYKNNGVIVIIGLTGEINGSAVICFEVGLACKIASAMMGGFSVEKLDDISKSAISELCNMIMGNTSTIYSQKGIHINITPPTMFTGENIEIKVHKSTILNIPIIFNTEEQIEIDISYSDIKK